MTMAFRHPYNVFMPPILEGRLDDHAGTAKIADWRCLDAALTWCYRGPVDPAYLRGTHCSADMIAWLIMRGSVNVSTANGDSLTAHAGQWVVLGTGIHQRVFSEDAVIVSVLFRASWADAKGIFEDGLPIVISSNDYPNLERQALNLVRYIEKCFKNPATRLLMAETSLAAYMRLQSLFFCWLSSVIDALSAKGLEHTRLGKVDDRVRRGLFWIDRLPLNQTFPKADLAKRLELSCSQLDRLFVKVMGFTPQHYFNQRRLHQARGALAEIRAQVKEVAYMVGFRSASHFSTWFRKHEGKSPRSFMTRAL